MERLLRQIKKCTVCEQHLEAGVNPVVVAARESRIIVIGQAPGRKVHETGIPWNDKSGDNLREWLGVGKEVFYDQKKFALMPMGFCYPGKGPGGDLPPRPECAALWHDKLMSRMKNAKLILLVGQYAQNHYLGENAKATLTENVKHFNEFLPLYFPLPHPSPRNFLWQKRNPWFPDEVLAELRKRVKKLL